jgi:DNA invertase Pin-like site-specific DNA recombinase
VVLAEALDRISRDQEDVAGVFKRMAFAGVKIITLSEGEITHLHVGLKGTMNALFLKDLADKTRRGMRGRVEAGKAGGGLCYGYDVIRRNDAAGEPVREASAVGIEHLAAAGAVLVAIRKVFDGIADADIGLVGPQAGQLPRNAARLGVEGDAKPPHEIGAAGSLKTGLA